MMTEKMKSGIIGFAVGDALGVPVEFLDRERLKSHPVKEMMGYGSHLVPEGTWSDDTSIMIAAMDSIIQNKDGTFKHIDYNEAYSDILKEYEEGDDDYYSASYGLYDIDHNGTYELIISYGTNDADWSNAVYEYTDSGAKYIGEITGSVGLYGAENRNGIYAVRGKMGSQTIRRITLDDENLTDDIILEEDVGEGDYYSNDDYVEMTDIYDYSAIESMD